MIEKSNRFEGIEALRAFAAISIILFHMPSSGGAALPESLNFISSHFGFGVPLFFVLSGFSMAHGYRNKFVSTDSLFNYYIRRFFRIAPLFYTILAFQLLNLWINNGITFTIFEILINATFTFNIIPTLTDGIVPASWTIGVEMIFYLLFPLIVIFLDNKRKIFTFLCLTIILASSFSIDMKETQEKLPSFIYHNFIINFPYFIWGMLGYYLFSETHQTINQNRKKHLSWFVLALALFCIYTLYSYSPLYMYFWVKGLRTTWDTLWGIPFVLLTICVALHPIKIISNKLTEYLGKISFSLYLVHPTVVYTMGKNGIYTYLYQLYPESKLIGFLLSFLVTITVIALISSLTFKFIEKPGMDYAKKISR